ncbi:MAG TPA: COX15/CtaA family protein [Gaiellaceae bacterium]|nr:COX15/CtaA family protein [Gaiellaceae bacterium]
MNAQPTALARLRGFELAPAQFVRLAFAELFALWLIIGTGAAVRLTESGLGCRHWPGCEPGHPLPAKNYHAFVEFGNRLVGGVVIVVTLVAWLASLRTPALPVWARRLALAIFVGTLLQAPLGYLAVRSDLKWPVVMAHLLLSMVLVAGAVVLALEGRGAVEGHIRPLVSRELQLLGYAFVVACGALLVSGTFATAAGPHSGGKDIHRFASLQPTVYAHAAVVAVFLGTFVFSLGYLTARRERSPRLWSLALAVFGVLLVQIAVGEIQWRTHLPWGVVLVHVLLAATVWAGTVALATLFVRPLRSLAPNVGLTDG